MSKAKIYGINHRKPAVYKEDMRFRKNLSGKGGKAIPKKKGNGCEKCV